MRIRFDGRRRRQSQMYFRGPGADALRRHRMAPARPAYALAGAPDPGRRAPDAGRRWSYTRATLEPLRVASIPLLEATTAVAPIEGLRLSRREDLQWLAERPIYERIRLRAEAYPRYALTRVAPYRGASGEPRAAARLQPAHPGLEPRIRAASPAGRNVDATAFANLVLRHIRDGGYDYTLSPGDYGRDAVDEFWLDRKTGLLRALRRRLRRRHARRRLSGAHRHRLPGRRGTAGRRLLHRPPELGARLGRILADADVGWVRADPTGSGRAGPASAAAPASTLQPGCVAGAIDGDEPGAVAPACAARWEAINNRWNQWVLNYSRGQQLDVLKQHRLHRRRLGGPRAAADRHAQRAGARRRRLGLARPAPRPIPWVRQLERLQARPAGRSASPPAPHEPPRTARGARVRDAPRRPPASRSRSCSTRSSAALRPRRRRARPDAGADASLRGRVAAPAQPLAQIIARATATFPIAAATDVIGASPARRRWPRPLASALQKSVAVRSRRRRGRRRRASSKAVRDRRRRRPDARHLWPARRRAALRRCAVAERRGLDPAWVRGRARRRRASLPNVARFIMPPPTGIGEELGRLPARFVEPIRIRAGARVLERQREVAGAWPRSCIGVPPEIVVGIVGVESIYGRADGQLPASSTPSRRSRFDFPAGPQGPQRDFFQDELENWFVLCKSEGHRPARA